jgi:hypothetical protein
LILLALPCAVRADDTGMFASIERDSAPISVRTEASGAAAPALDLNFDLDLSPGRPTGVRNIRPVASRAATSRPTPKVEAPFSVGLDLKGQRDLGSPASRATADEEVLQTLTDVEGVVRRSTFGLKGTYRF